MGCRLAATTHPLPSSVLATAPAFRPVWVAPVGSTARPAEAERNSVCSDVTPSGRFHDAAPNQRAVVSGAWSLGFCVLWFRRAISRFLSNHPEQSVDS